MITKTKGGLIMHYKYQIILKRWLPILKEYERTISKVTPRPFQFVKDLCKVHHISSKELRRYYVKWLQGNKRPFSRHCVKRNAADAPTRERHPPERPQLKAYRRLG